MEIIVDTIAFLIIIIVYIKYRLKMVVEQTTIVLKYLYIILKQIKMRLDRNVILQMKLTM